MEQKPIRTFILCDEKGNKYEINEFKTFGAVHTKNESIESKIIERPIYRLTDEREVIEFDGKFEILNPPDNIKLQTCEEEL